MIIKFCARCGSEQHSVRICPWPLVSTLVAVGALIAACLLAMMGVRE